jgi:hypothetical protein
MSTIVTIDATDQISASRADLNTNFANLNADKIETSVIDTDTALAANSDAKIPSQKAVKAYIDALGSLTAKTSGVSNGPASSSTQTVTHSLGRVPTVIRISGYGEMGGSSSSMTGGSSTGTYSSSGNRCVYVTSSIQAGANTVGTSTTYAVYLSALQSATNEAHASGVIQNVTSTTFDIVWTVTDDLGSDISAISAFIWEAN